MSATHDSAKVIWTDECAFNVGGAPGRVWVTRPLEQEFEESCLLPKLKKQESIIIWGCIVGRLKGPLIIWDKGAWGKTINTKGYQTHIVPHLDHFGNTESVRTNDYVYIQHDNASPHRARTTVAELQERGLYNYLMPWPADGIIIPVVEHCLRGEIAEARRTLTCMKEHQSVDIRNVLGHERMYRAYAET